MIDPKWKLISYVILNVHACCHKMTIDLLFQKESLTNLDQPTFKEDGRSKSSPGIDWSIVLC